MVDQYDAILVLTSGISPDERKSSGWRLDYSSQIRLRAGVALYEQGLAPLIIIAGGQMHGAHTPSLAAIHATVLQQRHHIPLEQILTEERSIDTCQNLEFSYELLRARGAHTVALTTTSDHLRRAAYQAQRYGVPFDIEVTPFEAEEVLRSVSRRHEQVARAYTTKQDMPKYVFKNVVAGGLAVMPFGLGVLMMRAIVQRGIEREEKKTMTPATRAVIIEEQG